MFWGKVGSWVNVFEVDFVFYVWFVIFFGWFVFFLVIFIIIDCVFVKIFGFRVIDSRRFKCLGNYFVVEGSSFFVCVYYGGGFVEDFGDFERFIFVWWGNFKLEYFGFGWDLFFDFDFFGVVGVIWVWWVWFRIVKSKFCSLFFGLDKFGCWGFSRKRDGVIVRSGRSGWWGDMVCR